MDVNLDQFHFMADSMPQLISINHADGSPEYTNNRWVEFTGQDPCSKDFIGWSRLIHPDDLPKAKKAWNKSLKTGEPYELEYRLHHEPTKNYRWVISRALPFKDEAGNISKWYGTCTDINEQKRFLQLERTNQDLRSEVLRRRIFEEFRTTELVELNRSKDEFISIASHQLRTPATGVKQYVGMLIEGFAGTLSKQQEQLLHKAYDSNERQLQIVSDLLRVAQVDAGKVMLRKTPVELAVLVGDIVLEQQNIVRLKQQTISYAPSKPEITILIDMASIRMVVENLIDNASKYSHEESLIEVSVVDNKSHVEVIVSDDGVGIDPEGGTRLFEKFSRIDNPLSTKVGGSGLGLYWARKIVELHGGTLTYKPNRPKGTTFVVKLPKGAKL